MNVFDVTFSAYGEAKFGMSSMMYSFASGAGSVVNILQTGWLFNKLLKWNVSIPIITSLTGVCGGGRLLTYSHVVIGIVWCLTAPNLVMALIGSLFFLIAYGCAAPTAPTIMSVRISHQPHPQTESTPSTQGVALSMVLIGGQSAYILAPNILGSLFSIDMNLPFLVSLVPCACSVVGSFVAIVVFIAMIVLHFIPGGRTAGQVPLRLALEDMMKEEKMRGVDNEYEMDVLASAGHVDADKQKKGENDASLETMPFESKKKENLDNADERYLMSLGDEGVDENAFMVPPRFDSIALTRRMTSTSSVTSTASRGTQQEHAEPDARSQKENEHAIHLSENSEEEDDDIAI